MEEEVQYGWFSPTQAERAGTCLYEKEDGSTVRVSMISTGPEQRTGYDDIECVGVVTRYLGEPDEVKQRNNAWFKALLWRAVT